MADPAGEFITTGIGHAKLAIAHDQGGRYHEALRYYELTLGALQQAVS
eukprot:CAMPEP_0198347506 /NCGR_PEP_ID=MMETSP1450-20131203/85296_1 /TAXON_ID=753684 ORGANISM="Madagascaria erythrocladiodes, Strain CCMP3234" /NCGR_SAMPLE_ID=MMETSP1450 /ASSEMBLY_ACC=CAM_ASM_001115 /LENGTH=47 /DNA_ID= /DNA_START= /DNA_END= /DNA_ORIENTATION=